VALILDTSFVIAVEREARRQIDGPASRFLSAHPREAFYITFTVAGELACGASASPEAEWRRICSNYVIFPWVEAISWQYGMLYRQLSAAGCLIGSNDLWIAATALVHQMPIVTANTREFSRIRGLSVVPF